MASISLPYNKEPVTLNIPDDKLSWVAHLGHSGHPFNSEEQVIREALAHPVGSPRLSEIVDSQKTVAVIVDDVTRPTPVALLLPFILEELKRGGVPDANIRLVIALGTHRVMTTEETVARYGRISPAIQIVNEDYRNAESFVNVGIGGLGQPIYVLKAVAEADIVVGVGNVVPHFYAGWGGGAKIIQPGVSDESTIESTHTLGVMKDNILNLCVNPENIVRKEMENIASVVGLDFIVNTVLDDRKEIANVFAGHYIKAHRAAVKFAEAIYRPEIPELADIVVTTAYPSQIDYWQGIKALVHAQYGVKPGGVIVFAMAANEGLAGGNEKHIKTILEWAPKSEEAIRNGIAQRASQDLIAMAFCLSHRQLVNRTKSICYSTGLDSETLTKLGFIPATSIDEAMNKAWQLAGKEARVGVVTYAGAAVRCRN